METKKQKIVSAVATIGIILTLFGATYAYFASRVDAGKTTDVEITANTVDVFSFETGDPISLSLDQENFASGTGNQTGETFAKATLTANNKTNTATEHYYVFLSIDNNTFEYTQENKTPELILQVTDPNGTEVTTLSGLEYKTVTDGKRTEVKGFDVTTFDGLVTIANNYEIVANNELTQTWTVKLVFVNLGADQTANAGNGLSAKLIIQNEIITFHESCNDNTLACYVAKQYTGIQGDNNLYYHDSTLENGAGDNSYRYAGGNYKLTEKAISEDFAKIDPYSETISNETLINYYCDGERDSVFEHCYNSWYFTLQYEGNSTQYASYKDAENQAISDGYLVDEVSNFICFGSDAETCPDDNLYRIIGVFGDQAKLIKWDYATSTLLGTDGDYYDTYQNRLGEWYYYKPISKGINAETVIGAYWWNNDDTTYGTNTWSTSKLNTVNLNINFINNIGTEWSNKIAKTTWKVGGNTWANILGSNAKTAYTNEITSPSTQVTSTYESKVGLMYVSDYYYGASPTYWTYPGYSDSGASYDYHAAIGENWMYMGLYEWTITRVSHNTSYVCFINDYGMMFEAYPGENGNRNAVRPVFYLNSDVTYKSGTGTKLDPITINLD